ncbi:hypothetical protein SprV_0802550300 [Sparganum proliferum]
MAGILDLGVISEPNTINVCKERHAGCVSFSDKQDNFKSYRRCLNDCRFKGDQGEIVAKFELCDDTKSNCFSFTNRNNNLQAFVRCYENCNIYQEEEHTDLNSMYICDSPGGKCLDANYHSRPEEKQQFNELKTCYDECEETKGGNV